MIYLYICQLLSLFIFFLLITKYNKKLFFKSPLLLFIISVILVVSILLFKVALWWVNYQVFELSIWLLLFYFFISYLIISDHQIFLHDDEEVMFYIYSKLGLDLDDLLEIGFDMSTFKKDVTRYLEEYYVDSENFSWDELVFDEEYNWRIIRYYISYLRHNPWKEILFNKLDEYIKKKRKK